MFNARSLALGALFTLLAGPALAMRVGGPIVVGPADPEPRGTYEATVKYLDPHYDPSGSGMYYTWSYYTISATSMTYCQSQLASWTSQPNVSVVEFCHLEP